MIHRVLWTMVPAYRHEYLIARVHETEWAVRLNWEYRLREFGSFAMMLLGVIGCIVALAIWQG